jgi:uncharacterized protein (TIGR03067 family)
MRHVVPLIALLTMAFAPAPFPKATKPDRRADLEKLQGSWVRVWYSSCGRWFSDGETIVEFAGNHMTMCRGDKSEWIVRIDPKKDPKHIDLKGLTDSVKDCQFVGVYRLDGDTLIIACCHGSTETDRPMNPDRGGAGIIVETLKPTKKR